MRKNLLNVIMLAIGLLSYTSTVNANEQGTCGTCSWVLDDNGCLVISPTDGNSGELADWGYQSPWGCCWDGDDIKVNDISAKIKSVSFEGSIVAKTCCNMFLNCVNLESADFTNLDTKNVKSMLNLLGYCPKLSTLNIKTLDTSNCQAMDGMFWDCAALETIDISNFDTRKAQSMGNLFHGCSSLKKLEFGDNFVTTNVTSMYAMFNLCSSLTELDVTKFSTDKVASMEEMFSGCYSLTTLDVSNFNTSSVTTMNNMFNGCSNIDKLDVSAFKTVNVVDMTNMFMSCSSITTLDLSAFDTEGVTNMQQMFRGCTSLESLTLNSFVVGNDTKTGSMFTNCEKLTTINVAMEIAPAIAETTFDTLPTLSYCKLVAPSEDAVASYKAATGWNVFGDNIVVKETPADPEPTPDPIQNPSTGISEVKADNINNVYSLSGVKLSAPVKGINIINGKKYLVK